MNNNDILKKITQGMYTLTTVGGGCIVDAVSQVSGGDSPLIAVAVMKKNYTNELLKVNQKFAISVLGKKVNPEIIKTFGFNSMRDIDKFQNIETVDIDGLNIIKDSLGYMICEIIDTIDNDTHTLFIGKLIKSELYEDSKAMSYQYYQEHKDELLKVKTDNGNTAWICVLCGYIYYGEEVPDDFKCPICGADKNAFERK